MTKRAPCRLWESGTWREAGQLIGGRGLCFSPDGRFLVVEDADRVMRLLETDSGRTVARFESPDLPTAGSATFSPDGSHLVVATAAEAAVHVWDLRDIRRKLSDIGLDWDASPYAETSAANQAPAPLKVVVELSGVGTDIESLVKQAVMLQRAGNFSQAIGVLRTAVRLEPTHATARNNLAWLLATAPDPLRDPVDAVENARRAVDHAPEGQVFLNTLGVALYRAGKFGEAVSTLEESLRAGNGEFDAFDLFFLAMAHHRLGHRAIAHDCYDRAVRWVSKRKILDESYARELAEFKIEAAAVIAGPAVELPDDVFAGPR